MVPTNPVFRLVNWLLDPTIFLLIRLLGDFAAGIYFVLVRDYLVAIWFVVVGVATLFSELRAKEQRRVAGTMPNGPAS